MTVTITGRNRYADETLTRIAISNKYSKILLVIEGGYIEHRGDTFVIAAKHPTAKDEEGDSAYVALIEGCGLVWTDMLTSTHHFTGALLSAKWVADDAAARQIAKQGHLDFTPDERPWTPGAYRISVEHLRGNS